MKDLETLIIELLRELGPSSSKIIFDNIGVDCSYATLKRKIKDLTDNKFLKVHGKGKSSKYELSPLYLIVAPVSVEEYFKKEIDERKIISAFNFSLINDILPNSSVFNKDELEGLNKQQQIFNEKIVELSELDYIREMERLAIDLSWKSSQIEGNTYSLLETERLLKDKQTASGKTKEEAIMLLNHKEAIDFIVENPDYLYPLSVSKIEDIHSILVKELGVDKNLRKRRVGITGTNYHPIDNEFQIKEALQISCEIINSKESVFEQALLALVLLSYIQPFMDGNKRTARIVSNAILINKQYCPISFRTVDSLDYKKAMLIFYEQNNISNFKRIFIEQFYFAVKTYF